MNFHSVPLSQTGLLPRLVENYLAGSDNLKHLFSFTPDSDGIESLFNSTLPQFQHRKELSEALIQQYSSIKDKSAVEINIRLLADENSYTVTTAHQLVLFTGPLYFVYKILSAVKLALILKEKYPQYNFIPVYWMGSEDHDFDEVNHLNVYGKRVEWKANESGPVGRFANAGIEEVINQLEEILGSGNEFVSQLMNEWKQIFKENKNYGAAFQEFVHSLFGKYGLVVVNQDDAALKKLFRPMFEKELTKSTVQNTIADTVEFLDKEYHVQASPREINLFYIKNGLRERIVKEEGVYKVLNTSYLFSESEILSELNGHPENFSPNVLLRPLYQQTILPSLVFVGGAGELSYWLQLKNAFEENGIFYPMLLLRDMAIHITPAMHAKMRDWQLNFTDIFTGKDELIRRIVSEKSTLQLSLDTEKDELVRLFSAISTKAAEIDKSLEKSVEAEKHKLLNSIENIESKMIRAEKKNQEQTVISVERFIDKIFPSGVLQERHDNMLPLLVRYKTDFFDKLLEAFNPLENQIHIVTED
jgi:bacillithiol synthase